jgi:TetR/AcrR family transcriptional regulator, transcriptional repressor for nem operon
MLAAITKEKIFLAAEGIIIERSFHSVGLNEILRAANVPKGSFYYYFESKDHFGAEMLQHYIDQATVEKSRLLGDSAQEPDPLRRLIKMLESSVCEFDQNGAKDSPQNKLLNFS